MFEQNACQASMAQHQCAFMNVFLVFREKYLAWWVALSAHNPSHEARTMRCGSKVPHKPPQSLTVQMPVSAAARLQITQPFLDSPRRALKGSTVL